MKFSIFISIISLLLVSCSSIKKVVLLDQQLKNDPVISTTDYSQHKLKEGDILHVKIIGVQDESFNIFNIENNANNNQTTSANLFLNGFTVDSEGNIEIPILGKIYIKGLNVEESKQKIQNTWCAFFFKDF